MTGEIVDSRTFLEVKVEAHTSLCTRNLLAQALLELLEIRRKVVVLRFHQRQVVLLHELQLRLELCEVHLLRVVVLVERGGEGVAKRSRDRSIHGERGESGYASSAVSSKVQVMEVVGGGPSLGRPS